MSRYTIEVQVGVAATEALAPLLQATAEAALEQEGAAPTASLTILLTDDARLRQLNATFLGLDEPTDVLSFPAGEPMPAMAAEVAGYLGDIAISLEQARRQADAGRHTLEAELQLLVAHGVLHLLGYNHLELDERRRMWAAQSAVLARVGAAISGPPPE
jgi:probable rRNA maturation factor